MKLISNINDIVKILRTVLIQQSELNADRVLNSLSMYGTELDKLIEDEKYGAIDQNDALLLFELLARATTYDMSETENDAIQYYKAFTMHVIIYGNTSSDIAIKLINRLRTETVRAELQSNDIYLESVSDVTLLNEYKNDSMWLRADFDINIAAQFTITKVTISDNYEQLGQLSIINKGGTI